MSFWKDILHIELCSYNSMADFNNLVIQNHWNNRVKGVVAHPVLFSPLCINSQQAFPGSIPKISCTWNKSISHSSLSLLRSELLHIYYHLRMEWVLTFQKFRGHMYLWRLYIHFSASTSYAGADSLYDFLASISTTVLEYREKHTLQRVTTYH